MKSIVKIIEEVVEEMCDKYCKWPGNLPVDENGDIIDSPDLPCTNCPLNKLM